MNNAWVDAKGLGRGDRGSIVIAILEDDDRRRTEMARVLNGERISCRMFDDARKMILYFSSIQSPNEVSIVSLDHDLILPDVGLKGARGGLRDLGDGMMVVDWLVTNKAPFPVIIHTANSNAGQEMESTLLEAGHRAYWTVPFDDVGWISARWIRLVWDMVGGCDS